MIYGQNLFDQPVKSNLGTMIVLEKLQQVKKRIIKLAVCLTKIISTSTVI